MLEIINKNLLTKIVSVIEQAKEKAIRSVDHERTLMYWQIGQYIVEEEQNGEERAEYGKYVLKYLVENLEPLYGSGFQKDNYIYLFNFTRHFQL